MSKTNFERLIDVATKQYENFNGDRKLATPPMEAQVFATCAVALAIDRLADVLESSKGPMLDTSPTRSFHEMLGAILDKQDGVTSVEVE